MCALLPGLQVGIDYKEGPGQDRSAFDFYSEHDCSICDPIFGPDPRDEFFEMHCFRWKGGTKRSCKDTFPNGENEYHEEMNVTRVSAHSSRTIFGRAEKPFRHD